MRQKVSFTYRHIVGLSLLLSVIGALSLALSGVLPWPVFIAISLVHVLAMKMPYDKDIISARIVTMILLGLIFLEVVRVWTWGMGEVAIAIRDMIIALDIARLLLKKELREVYQILGISFSELVFATVFTLSLTFTISLVFMIFLIPLVLYLADAERFGFLDHVPGPMHWLKVGTGVVLLTCIIFYVIPRPYDTILKFNSLHRHKKVFSEDINLGQGTDISLDNSIVMRIVWHDKPHPRAFLLSGAHLEKATITGFERSSRKINTFRPASHPMHRLTIYPQDIEVKNVFHPFSLVKVSPGDIRKEGDDYYWRSCMPAVYDVWVSETPGRSEACSVQVPPGLEDVAGLARRIAPEGTAGKRVAALTAYLRHHCRYSLVNQYKPRGLSPIKWFVMNGGEGDCEYFATSLALMLRGLGIPSRVVTGFYVHEYNPLGGYYIVRASSAHAWVEYWDKGAWHTQDPTPPEPGLYRLRPNLIDEIRFRWIRWVIHYSLNDQVYFASHVRNTIINPGRNAIYWISGLLLAAAMLWLGFSKGLRHLNNSFYDQVLVAFSKRGVKLDTKASHGEHLRYVENNWPVMARYFSRYLEDYLLWRFGKGDIDIASITGKFVKRIKSSPS